MESGYRHINKVSITGKEGLLCIEPEEINNIMELRSAQTEEDGQEQNHAELRIKLHQAMTRNRQERALHEQLLEQEAESIIKEETAEKNSLVNRVKELKQEVERLKNKRLVEETEEDKPEQNLENAVISQSLYLKQTAEDFNKHQRQHRQLSIQQYQLVTERNKTLDSLSKYLAAEITLKIRLKTLRNVICVKDKEIQQMCTDIKATMNKICNSDIRKELNWKNALDGTEKGQGYIKVVLRLCKNSRIFPEAIPQGPINETCEEKKKTTRSAEYIWKVTGALTLCGLGVLVFMPPLFSPNYDLWTILFETVESYSELQLAFPSLL